MSTVFCPVGVSASWRVLGGFQVQYVVGEVAAVERGRVMTTWGYSFPLADPRYTEGAFLDGNGFMQQCCRDTMLIILRRLPDVVVRALHAHDLLADPFRVIGMDSAGHGRVTGVCVDVLAYKNPACEWFDPPVASISLLTGDVVGVPGRRGQGKKIPHVIVPR